jgi:hypothetical protein
MLGLGVGEEITSKWVAEGLFIVGASIDIQLHINREIRGCAPWKTRTHQGIPSPQITQPAFLQVMSCDLKTSNNEPKDDFSDFCALSFLLGIVFGV